MVKGRLKERQPSVEQLLPVGIPELEPRIVYESLVVVLIDCREVGGSERAWVGEAEDVLQCLDLRD